MGNLLRERPDFPELFLELVHRNELLVEAWTVLTWTDWREVSCKHSSLDFISSCALRAVRDMARVYGKDRPRTTLFRTRSTDILFGAISSEVYPLEEMHNRGLTVNLSSHRTR